MPYTGKTEIVVLTGAQTDYELLPSPGENARLNILYVLMTNVAGTVVLGEKKGADATVEKARTEESAVWPGNRPCSLSSNRAFVVTCVGAVTLSIHYEVE